jgi:hypothetical protein
VASISNSSSWIRPSASQGLLPSPLTRLEGCQTENAQPGQHHGKYNPDPFRLRASQGSAMAAFWEQAII